MITFSKKELLELGGAWLILSIAFTILFSNPIEYGLTPEIIVLLVISLLTAGLGFVIHELSHKLVAERYGFKTRFIADFKMLGLAIVLSFFGFIFAAPGAVYISGRVSQAQNGRISFAGPFSNLILALAFLPASIMISGIMGVIATYGFIINSWIGLFNMIPVGNIDGAKIIKWNKPLYFALTIILLGLSIYGMYG